MSGESPFQSLDLDMIDDGTMELQQSKPIQNKETNSTSNGVPPGASSNAPSAPAFASFDKTQSVPQSSVQQTGQPAQSFKPISNSSVHLGVAKVVESVEPYREPVNVFATGLPDWNLDPPGEMVTRRPTKKSKGAEQ